MTSQMKPSSPLKENFSKVVSHVGIQAEENEESGYCSKCGRVTVQPSSFSVATQTQEDKV